MHLKLEQVRHLLYLVILVIADRQGRSFKKLAEIYSETDEVGFKTTERVDGKLLLSEAVQALKMA